MKARRPRYHWTVTYLSERYGMWLLAILGIVAIGKLYIPIIVEWLGK
jgi:hypothetical protein